MNFTSSTIHHQPQHMNYTPRHTYSPMLNVVSSNVPMGSSTYATGYGMPVRATSVTTRTVYPGMETHYTSGPVRLTTAPAAYATGTTYTSGTTYGMRSVGHNGGISGVSYHGTGFGAGFGESVRLHRIYVPHGNVVYIQPGTQMKTMMSFPYDVNVIPSFEAPLEFVTAVPSLTGNYGMARPREISTSTFGQKNGQIPNIVKHRSKCCAC